MLQQYNSSFGDEGDNHGNGININGDNVYNGTGICIIVLYSYIL